MVGIGVMITLGGDISPSVSLERTGVRQIGAFCRHAPPVCGISLLFATFVDEFFDRAALPPCMRVETVTCQDLFVTVVSEATKALTLKFTEHM